MNLKNPDKRFLSEIKTVVYDKEWLETVNDDIELYDMYRGVDFKNDLRYDITVIPSKMLGTEFVKTKGHYHPGSYGEVYIVLEGQAIYLMQKINQEGEIEDIYAVEARKGDCVVIPPHYGHITINPGKETLKMANWVYNDFQSEYGAIEEMGGAGYFYTINGWIKNEKYKNLPDLRIEKTGKKIPENLDFLKGNKN